MFDLFKRDILTGFLNCQWTFCFICSRGPGPWLRLMCSAVARVHAVVTYTANILQPVLCEYCLAVVMQNIVKALPTPPNGTRQLDNAKLHTNLV